MKVWIKTLVFVMSFVFPPLTAYDCFSMGPCNWDLYNRRFLLQVEFLCWRPCIDDLDFAFSFMATNDETQNTVNFKKLCPGWEPGLRVSFEKPDFWCQWDIGLSWTYLKTRESSNLKAPTGGNVSSPYIHPGLLPFLQSEGRFEEVKGSYESGYHDFSLVTYFNLPCTRCAHVRPFMGVAGVYLNQELTVRLEGEEEQDRGKIHWESDYLGLGLKAGLFCSYDFDVNFSLYVNADGTLLTGQPSSKNKQFVMSDESKEMITFEDRRCCHAVPGVHLSTGIVGRTCVCCYPITFIFGYEFVEWFNLFNPRHFFGENLNAESAHSDSKSTRSLAFHGFNVGLRFVF